MSRSRGKSRTRNPQHGEDEVQDLWGQLWFFPNSQSSCDGARVRDEKRDNLVWVRRDLLNSKAFDPLDCYPVGENDTWD